MQGDPTGSAATAPALDTTAAPSDAPAASEPTADGAVAVEGQSSEPAAPDQPTPESTDSAEDDGDTDDGSDDSTPETDAEQTEEQKKLSRKERQRLREQERIEREVAAALARKEAEQREAEAARERQAAAEAAAKARQEKLAAFLGTPDQPNKPGSLAQLQAEIADLNRQIRSELTNPQGVDLEDLTAKVGEREARVERLTENNAMAREIEDLVWSSFEADFVSASAFPELSDPAVKQRYLRAEGGVKGALGVLREAIIAAKDAEKAAEIKALTERHQSQVKAIEADRNAWRVRAGGAEIADTTSGGSASTDGHVYTRARLAEMMRTPEGMAEYRRNRAEIERQASLGLIR